MFRVACSVGSNPPLLPHKRQIAAAWEAPTRLQTSLSHLQLPQNISTTTAYFQIYSTCPSESSVATDAVSTAPKPPLRFAFACIADFELRTYRHRRRRSLPSHSHGKEARPGRRLSRNFRRRSGMCSAAQGEGFSIVGRAGTDSRYPQLFEKKNIKASWYIPGHTIESFPREMAAIRDAGHEIGLQ